MGDLGLSFNDFTKLLNNYSLSLCFFFWCGGACVRSVAINSQMI